MTNEYVPTPAARLIAALDTAEADYLWHVRGCYACKHWQPCTTRDILDERIGRAEDAVNAAASAEADATWKRQNGHE